MVAGSACGGDAWCWVVLGGAKKRRSGGNSLVWDALPRCTQGDLFWNAISLLDLSLSLVVSLLEEGTMFETLQRCFKRDNVHVG
jgi:hypothetical protein